jgi:hypothetical protein
MNALWQKARLGLEIAAGYVRVRLLLRRRDVRGALAELRDAPARPEPVTHRGAIRLAHAVQRTLRVLPGDTRCLTQSLVLVSVLARRGLDSTVVIAVAPGEDFDAHAWVEHRGKALLPMSGPRFGRLVEL